MSVSQPNQPSTNDSPEAIQAHIEQTRAQMGQTIDEIQDRLSPHRLVSNVTDSLVSVTQTTGDQVRQYARDTSQQINQTLERYMRENPMTGALASFVLLAMSHKPQHTPHRTGGTMSTTDPYYSSSASYDETTSTGTSTMKKVQDTAGQLTDKVQGAASKVTGTAQSQLSQVTNQVQNQTQQAQGWLANTFNRNPLLVGAIALAAGVAIGLSIPETSVERQAMGDTRDKLVSKAADATQDAVQQVQGIAQDTVQRVQGVVQESISNAQQQARNL